MTHVPCITFDTDELASELRFPAWQAAVSTYETRLPDGRSPDDFRAWARAWHLGDMIVTDSRLPAVRFQRTAELIAKDGVDTYNFIVLTEGTWQGRAGGHSLVVGPGQLVSFDLTRPFEAEAIPTRSVALVFRRAAFDEAARGTGDLHGRIHDGFLATMLIGYMLALPQHLEESDERDVPGVQRAILAHAAGIVEALPVATLGELGNGNLHHRIRHHVEQRLTDGALTPRQVAHELGIARSTLYRCFAASGGIASYIQRRRLEIVRMFLSDGSDRRSVAELAMSCGFTSPSHFSAAFRAAYGVTPREYRLTMRCLVPVTDVVAPLSDRFAEWIDRLKSGARHRRPRLAARRAE